MDTDILALIVGSAAGLAVLATGGWAFVRSRGKKSSDRTDEQSGGEEESSAPSTPTAVKERPAAPSWADTLSAPAPPTQTPAEQTEAEGTETATDEPRAEAAQTAPAPVESPAAHPGPSRTDEDSAPPQTPKSPAVPEHDAEGAAPTTQPHPPQEAAEPDPASAETSAPGDTAGADAAPAVIDTPEAPGDRMVRLRERLSRSGSIGRGILNLLTRSSLDEDTWDEIEETLLLADLGPDATDELMDNLRRRIQVLGTDDAAGMREILREELLALVDPGLDRRLAASRRTAPDDTEVPSVLLMVGVNGTGKTTTVGKLARVLVAAERTVVLGAADTFRAAAADQLATWGARVGVDTVRSDREGADPAAVAFDAVRKGIDQSADVVIIDTAGRLQNKKGLMDELGKVRRVSEKGLHGDEVAEVLLVIDATTGQNGMQQARVFSEAVNITGIVLTKLDGTAKGGIVVNVQRELGVPVKMVGLGEGMDDLTPFDAHGFVDALLDG